MNKSIFSLVSLLFMSGVLSLYPTSSIAGPGSQNGGGNSISSKYEPEQYRIEAERTASFANAQELLKKEFAKEDAEFFSKQILDMDWYKVPNPVAIIGVDDKVTIVPDGNYSEAIKLESNAKSAVSPKMKVFLNSKKFDELSPSSQGVELIWHTVLGSTTNEQLRADMYKFDRVVQGHNLSQEAIDKKRISIIKSGLHAVRKNNVDTVASDHEEAATPAAKSFPPSEKEESFEGHATLGD